MWPRAMYNVVHKINSKRAKERVDKNPTVYLDLKTDKS